MVQRSGTSIVGLPRCVINLPDSPTSMSPLFPPSSRYLISALPTSPPSPFSISLSGCQSMSFSLSLPSVYFSIPLPGCHSAWSHLFPLPFSPTPAPLPFLFHRLVVNVGRFLPFLLSIPSSSCQGAPFSFSHFPCPLLAIKDRRSPVPSHLLLFNIP